MIVALAARASSSPRRRISCSAVRIGASGLRSSWPSIARNSSLARLADSRALAARRAAPARVTSNATTDDAVDRRRSRRASAGRRSRRSTSSGGRRRRRDRASAAAPGRRSGSPRRIDAVEQLVDALARRARAAPRARGLPTHRRARRSMRQVARGWPARRRARGRAGSRSPPAPARRRSAAARRCRSLDRAHARRASSCDLDARQQLARRERLDQVVVGARAAGPRCAPLRRRAPTA